MGAITIVATAHGAHQQPSRSRETESFTVCPLFGDERRAKNLRCPPKVRLHRLINPAQTSVMLSQMSIVRSGAAWLAVREIPRTDEFSPCSALIFALLVQPKFV